jgi:hypothetical protein
MCQGGKVVQWSHNVATIRGHQFEPGSVQKIFCRVFCSLPPLPSFWLPFLFLPEPTPLGVKLTHVSIIFLEKGVQVPLSALYPSQVKKTSIKPQMVVSIQIGKKKRCVIMSLHLNWSKMCF